MRMYHLIEYSDNYSKTSGSLWQYCRNEQSLDNNGNVSYFPDANHTSNSFRYKQKNSRSDRQHGIKDVKILIPLKYLSNFWRTLEMLLINWEVNILLTCSKKCVIASNTTANRETKFAISNIKPYVKGLILSTQDNSKLLQQLKSGFKRTVN